MIGTKIKTAEYFPFYFNKRIVQILSQIIQQTAISNPKMQTTLLIYIMYQFKIGP